MTLSPIRGDRRTTRIAPIIGILLLLAPLEGAAAANPNRETPTVRAVRRVSPAVVNISSEYEIRKKSNPFSIYGMDPMLEKFFRDFFSPELERRDKRTSLGSGVIIDGSSGLVLTNAHVIENASLIRVALNDQREFNATLVGMDPDSDLALLKIDSEQSLPSIKMGDSDDILIGESVIAIGNPFGFSHTVTTGVISAVNRSIRTGERVFHQFIQTDASINPGNSGGPLLNIDGELIGINTAIFAEAQGIGFAIPINRARRIVSDLVNYGEVIQPWIGMTVQPLNEQLADYLDLTTPSGVLVTRVETDSPATAAGIQEGDIIVSMDGVSIAETSSYFIKIRSVTVNQTLSIDIVRNGRLHRLSLTARQFPLERSLMLADHQLGIQVVELSDRLRARYGIQTRSGVVIERVRRGSHLEGIGVRPGDLIHQIDEHRLQNLDDFKTAIAKYRNKPSIVLLIQRDAHLYHINTPMKTGGGS